MKKKTSRIAYFTRRYRRLHRLLGLSLILFVVLSSVSGILLAWKKNIDLLQPPTQKGQQAKLEDWLPVAIIAQIGQQALVKAYPNQGNNSIERIDLRPSKSIAKCIFKQGNWEVQVDAVNGNIKSIAKRHSDWIEALHDGSIVSNFFKLVSMNFLGIGLVILSLTGFLLWRNPRWIRRLKQKTKAE